MLTPLLEAAQELDADATCDRDALIVHLPKLRVHLRAAGQEGLDWVTIESFEPINASLFWDKLLGQLRTKTQSTSAPTPRRGIMMIAIATCLIALASWHAFSDRQQVVEGFRDWLWR